jgi:HTH-type transcriptional regulator, sugar sensing transcriptional regulator
VTIQHEDIQTLTHLGLTDSQGKVYLALAKLGRGTAKKVSDITHIDRADTYRVMSRLQRIGLVKRIVSTPTTFAVTTPHDSLHLLLENKINETNEVKIKTKELIQKINAYHKEGFEQAETQRFIVLDSKETIIENTKKAIRKMKKSIDIIVSLTMAQKAIGIYAEDLAKAIGRGKTVRLILEAQSVADPLPNSIKMFFINYPLKPLIVIKNTNQRFIIVDNKEIFFLTSNNETTESTALWTDNLALLATLTDYFETTWNTGLEKKRAKREIFS